jgi:hypothetical protein
VLTEVDGRKVYRIDLAFRPAREHVWNQEHVPAGDWSVEWRPMAEFEALRRERLDEMMLGDEHETGGA